MKIRESYETDLTDIEMQLLEPLIPEAKTSGRPRDTDMWEVLNAIFYQVRSGSAWRLMPHDFPAWNGLWLFPHLA